MRKVILIILVFLSIISLALRFGTKPLNQIMGVQNRAGLRIESNSQAKVLINSKESGNTPYQNENLTEGDYLITLQPDGDSTQSAKAVWQGYAKLNTGTLTVVNREMEDTLAASSGETISLEKGKGVTVISTPNQAEVFIDGVSKGRTPLSIADISSGEHQFLISRDNYQKRSIRATLVDGYNLVLTVDLAIADADLTKLPSIPVTQTQEVTVNQTPTGFLRIRSTASVNGAEVTRVNPGETLTLLEELPNWDRVRTKDNKEGYVASSYVTKKTSDQAPK